MYVCIPLVSGAFNGQQRISGPLELELQVIMNRHVCAESKVMSSAIVLTAEPSLQPLVLGSLLSRRFTFCSIISYLYPGELFSRVLGRVHIQDGNFSGYFTSA